MLLLQYLLYLTLLCMFQEVKRLVKRVQNHINIFCNLFDLVKDDYGLFFFQ